MNGYSGYFSISFSNENGLKTSICYWKFIGRKEAKNDESMANELIKRLFINIKTVELFEIAEKFNKCMQLLA